MWTGAWPSLEITNLARSLNDLGTLVRASNRERGEDVDAALARFLVVRTCGYIEQVVDECCKAYIRSRSDPRCAAFGASWFGRGRNPNNEALVSLVRRFDSGWATDLENLMNENDEFIARELAFLVDRRNKIAHGLNEGVGIVRALNLMSTAELVTTWFVTTMDPR